MVHPPFKYYKVIACWTDGTKNAAKKLKSSCVFDRLNITWKEKGYRRPESDPSGQIEGLVSAERSGATLFTRGEYIDKEKVNILNNVLEADTRLGSNETRKRSFRYERT